MKSITEQYLWIAIIFAVMLLVGTKVLADYTGL